MRASRWFPLVALCLLIASDSHAGQRRIDVALGGFAFGPDTQTLNQGDQVTWVWVSGAGTHTVTNGTNPDVLVLIEATSAGQAPAQWKYAVVGLTYAEFHVRIGETEVYQMPFPPRMDTWAIRIVPRTD